MGVYREIYGLVFRVKELKLGYHNTETVLFTIHP